MKEEQGEDDCEFVTVTLTCFEPRISILVFYGQQEGTTSRETICQHLASVLAAAEKLAAKEEADRVKAEKAKAEAEAKA